MHTSIIRRPRVINSGIGGLSPKGIAVPGNNTALDGSQNGTSSGATTVLPTLVTSAAGIVCVFVEMNQGIGATTVVGSALGAYTYRSTTNGLGSNPISLWYAISSGPVSETITVTPPGAGFVEATAFGVKGVNTASNNGFDPQSGASLNGSIAGTVLTVSGVSAGNIAVGQLLNGAGIGANTLTIVSLGTGTGGTGTYNLNQTPGSISGAMTTTGLLGRSTTPISYITGNANDFLIFGSRNGGDAGPPTGFTIIHSGSFMTTAYKIVTATQSISVSDPSGTSNGAIADALVST